MNPNNLKSNHLLTYCQNSGNLRFRWKVSSETVPPGRNFQISILKYQKKCNLLFTLRKLLFLLDKKIKFC